MGLYVLTYKLNNNMIEITDFLNLNLKAFKIKFHGIFIICIFF